MNAYRSLGTHAALVAAMLALAGAPAALGQSALGDGRRLDNNLQQGVGRVNPAGRDFAAEAQFRNAIVTGNVAGGFGFRGNVGYAAADDFRATLGSNRQFGFERDSFFSGLGGRGLRAVDAIQQQMAFTIGGQVDLDRGVPIIRRSGSNEGITHILANENPDQERRRIQTVSAYNFREGSLRSTSEFVAERPISPRVLLAVAPKDEEGVRFLVGSPLRGVAIENAVNYERPRSSDLVTGRIDESRVDSRIEAQSDDRRIENRLSPYEKLLEDMRAATEEKEGKGPPDARDGADASKGRDGALRDPIRDLLDRATPRNDLPKDDENEGATRPTRNDAGRPDAGPGRPLTEEKPDIDPSTGGLRVQTAAHSIMERLVQPAAKPGVDPWRELTDSQRETLVRDARRLIGEVQPKVDHLVSRKEDLRDPFTERMRAGEAQLAAGNWFDAEESFSVALQMRQGDPMAAAGRINAQIAAGLFLSAAMNLEALQRTYPEMMPVRFDRKLLPSSKRLDQVRSELRSAIARDPEMAQGPGLILAYLGRQFDNAADISDGFKAIDRATAAGGHKDPLYDVLRAVWLKE